MTEFKFEFATPLRTGTSVQYVWYYCIFGRKF